MDQQTLHPPNFTTCHHQAQSPLFSTLPPEIRSQIFNYTLSPIEDKTKLYAKETYWARPDYSAPHKTYTELLRTCKRVYAESWFMPFALAEHSFYLVARDRAPSTRANWRRDKRLMEGWLRVLNDIHGEGQEQGQGHDGRKVEVGDVRVFAQLYLLGPGELLQSVLDAEHLLPKQVHLTLRYTDFWHWENTRPLYIGGKWVGRVRFPGSVKVFAVDFESLERRKEEVDILVSQAVEKWVFRRKDGRTLAAKPADLATTKWTGSSMFGGKRWIRDELRPGELDYYVVTATWKLQPPSAADSTNEEETDMTVRVPDGYRQLPPPFTGQNSISRGEMERAGVGMDTPAEQAVNAIREAMVE
jgi:PAS domain-containing protein